MKKKHYLLGALASVLMTSGCAQMDQLNQSFQNLGSNNRLAVYNESQDKEIVDTFYVINDLGDEYGLVSQLEESGYELTQLQRSTLSFRRDVASDGNMNAARNRMSQMSFDAEGDLVAKKYIAMANDRGNLVKSFRPVMTGQINRIFALPFSNIEQSYAWLDRDVLLVEYDSANRPVSILARSYQATTMLGVVTRQYSTLLFGEANMRHFENQIGNRTLEDAFLREHGA